MKEEGMLFRDTLLFWGVRLAWTDCNCKVPRFDNK